MPMMLRSVPFSSALLLECNKVEASFGSPLFGLYGWHIKGNQSHPGSHPQLAKSKSQSSPLNGPGPSRKSKKKEERSGAIEHHGDSGAEAQLISSAELRGVCLIF